MPALLPSVALLAIFYFATHSRYPRSKGYIALGLILTVYLSITLELVGFPDLKELRHMLSWDDTIFNPTLNYIPFANGLNITDILNFILLVPLGFILPAMWKKFKPFQKTLLFGFLFILLIETAQLFTMNRITDINDLIMNTSGLIAGWLIYRFIFRVSVAGEKEKNREWIIPFALPFLFTFIF